MALIAKIRWLVKQTGLRRLCLAGGVAYNCRAVGRLARSKAVEHLYVGPAAGDQGQCIGNAIYGAIKRKSPLKIGRISPYLGLPLKINARDVIDEAAAVGPDLAVTQPSDCAGAIAEKLVSGAIGAVFQGRSEFGLRALGNRSIIALPNARSTRWRLNLVKKRDLFMPFAPVITAEAAHRYIVPDGDFQYMTAAVETSEEFKHVAAAALHVDGTARVQTVRKEECEHLYRLLAKVEAITGHPVLINTSFNQGGKPIAETITDAIRVFWDLALDFLWIGNVLVERGHCPAFLQNAAKIDCVEISGRTFREVDLSKLAESPSNFDLPMQVAVRDLFMLFADYVKLFRSGRKVTTIRYRKGAIDVPRRTVLPLYASANFSRDASVEYVGTIWVTSFRVIHFGQLSERDAARDGFADLAELRKALTEIYGPIAQEEWVTVYSISSYVA